MKVGGYLFHQNNHNHYPYHCHYVVIIRRSEGWRPHIGGRSLDPQGCRHSARIMMNKNNEEGEEESYSSYSSWLFIIISHSQDETVGSAFGFRGHGMKEEKIPSEMELAAHYILQYKLFVHCLHRLYAVCTLFPLLTPFTYTLFSLLTLFTLFTNLILADFPIIITM